MWVHVQILSSDVLARAVKMMGSLEPGERLQSMPWAASMSPVTPHTIHAPHHRPTMQNNRPKTGPGPTPIEMAHECIVVAPL